jgi:hypothetical protein
LVPPQRGQLLPRRNLSVFDIYDLISKSEPDDVRWEMVKQFKLILTNAAYAVPTERVAARLIEQMLERDRYHRRQRRSKLSSNLNNNSAIGEAGLGAS